MRTYYLDNAATSPMLPAVRDVMIQALEDGLYGNPSSVYPLGLEARKAVDKARHQVAQMIGADDDEIIFTSGATESNNFVVRHFETDTFADAWISAVEHPSVTKAFVNHYSIMPYKIYPDKFGILPQIENPDEMSYGVASVMLANNETGLVHNIDVLADRFDYFHTDITQFVPHRQIDIHNFCGRDFIDFASFSAHKFGGPKGVGALFVNRRNRDVNITPLFGGGGQEFGLRSGTENVLGIIGMGEAAEHMSTRYDEVILQNRIAEYATIILDTIPSAWLNFYPHIPVFSVCVPDVSNASLVMACGMRGVYISAGSACHGNGEEPSEVLLNMGLSVEEAKHTIRISPISGMSMRDFRDACIIIAECAKMLQTQTAWKA